MSSLEFLNKVLAGLTPPPHINPIEYDGWQYKWRFFVFRPALFKNELYILFGLLFYIGVVLYGRSSNFQKANKWLDAHLSILEQQFSRPTNDGLTQDGYSDFFNFSTGRRNVASLHTIFTLRPRHDFFQWGFQFLKTLIDLQYRPKDDIQLDFKLLPGALASDFVWAIVAKDELVAIKSDRWDLTFTKTTESPGLPPSLSVMSEFADVTENILKPVGNFSIANILNNPVVLPYFRSLSVTDQPRERPSSGPLPPNEREKHVILSLVAPPVSDAAHTFALVASIFPFIDSLSKVHLRPETKVKLKRVREDVDKELKEDVEKEKNEEISQVAEDKKAAKRKAEQERISQLSAAEQKKIAERDRKRSIRKSQAKTSVRK